MVKKYVCATCKKSVGYTKLPIQCDDCQGWFHGTCENISQIAWKHLGKSELNWYCNQCAVKVFPFNNLSDEELQVLVTDISDTSVYKRCMEFQNVELGYSSFHYDNEDDVDRLIKHNTNYVTHEQLSKIKNGINSKFSIMHFNARSLNKNFENIENMLHCTDVKLSVIGISETWLTDKCNKDYYSMNGYNSYFTNRSVKKVEAQHYLYIQVCLMNCVQRVHTV